MGITNSNKVISADRIDCDGSLKVTLALTAAPDIISNPTDIALILDRSGSMAGAPLSSMKAGAKTFIDIISQSTGGQPTGEIGAGSRIGIVSFADTAVQDAQMITSVDTLKDAVDGLTAGEAPTTPTPSSRPRRSLSPAPAMPRSWSCSPTGIPRRVTRPLRWPPRPGHRAL